MKTMNKLFLGLGFCAGLVSCSDFDEVNTNPTAAGEEYVSKHSASCVFFSPLFLPTFVASL